MTLDKDKPWEGFKQDLLDLFRGSPPPPSRPSASADLTSKEEAVFDELTRLREEVARLREQLGKLPSEDLWTQSLAELCRLRAAIAPTKENVKALVAVMDDTANTVVSGTSEQCDRIVVEAILAAINERAKP